MMNGSKIKWKIFSNINRFFVWKIFRLMSSLNKMINPICIYGCLLHVIIWCSPRIQYQISVQFPQPSISWITSEIFCSLQRMWKRFLLHAHVIIEFITPSLICLRKMDEVCGANYKLGWSLRCWDVELVKLITISCNCKTYDLQGVLMEIKLRQKSLVQRVEVSFENNWKLGFNFKN